MIKFSKPHNCKCVIPPMNCGRFARKSVRPVEYSSPGLIVGFVRTVSSVLSRLKNEKYKIEMFCVILFHSVPRMLSFWLVYFKERKTNTFFFEPSVRMKGLPVRANWLSDETTKYLKIPPKNNSKNNLRKSLVTGHSPRLQFQ